MSEQQRHDKNYMALAEHAIRRIADHHDDITEALLIVDVREAIEKAVSEARTAVGQIKIEVSRAGDGRVFTNVLRAGKSVAHLSAGQSYVISPPISNTDGACETCPLPDVCGVNALCVFRPEAPRTAPSADADRLNWLEQREDGFANIDRITSVNRQFNGKATLREAIDVARTVAPTAGDRCACGQELTSEAEQRNGVCRECL